MNFIRIDFIFGVDYNKDGGAILRDEQHAALKLIEKEAGEIFGAYTLYPHRGAWTNDSGKLVVEDGYTLTTVQEGTDFTSRPHMIALVQAIKGALNQESVAVMTSPVNFQLL